MPLISHYMWPLAVLRHIVRILSRVTFHSEREPDDREPRDRGAARARARRQHDQEARPRLPGHHESRARGITRETRRVRAEYEFRSAIGAREIEERDARRSAIGPTRDARRPAIGRDAKRAREAWPIRDGDGYRRAQRDAAEPTRAPTRRDTERSPLLQASIGSAPRRFAPPFRAASLHRSARGVATALTLRAWRRLHLPCQRRHGDGRPVGAQGVYAQGVRRARSLSRSRSQPGVGVGIEIEVVAGQGRGPGQLVGVGGE